MEISHEALLTEWDTLRGWIDDARDDLRTHRHLVAEMTAWTASDGSPDYLLRGGRLDAVAEWAATTTMGLRPAELRFLDASLALRADEQRVRQEEERRTTAAERRARRRTRQLALAAVVTAVVALATFAWAQRQDARRSEADLTDQPGRATPRHAGGEHAVDRPRAVAAPGQGGGVGDGRTAATPCPRRSTPSTGPCRSSAVQYDVTPDTPTAARSGPGGVRGLWVLPVEDLMSLADGATERTLTAEECRRYVDPAGCPAPSRWPASSTSTAPTPTPVPLRSIRPRSPSGMVPVQRSTTSATSMPSARSTASASGSRGSHSSGRRSKRPPSVRTPTSTCSASPELAELAAARHCSTFGSSSTRPNWSTTTARTSRPLRGSARRTWPSDTGPIHGVIVGASSKATVWTNEPEFSDLGYQRAL